MKTIPYETWSGKKYDDSKLDLINNSNTTIEYIIIHHSYRPSSKIFLECDPFTLLRGVEVLSIICRNLCVRTKVFPEPAFAVKEIDFSILSALS